MTTLLVLLPGMDGTGELFAPFVDALGPAQPVQVLRYPVDRPMGYAELLRWVAPQLPATAPYVLLGESFSGPIAWRLAASAGENCMGLVLCCSFARNPLPLLAPLAGLCDVVRWQALPGICKEWAMLGHAAPLPARQAFRDALAQVAPSVLNAWARAVLRLPEAPTPLRPQWPVLCLSARNDRVVPRTAAAALQRALPHARQATLPGPHGLLQINPTGAAHEVRAFLRSLAPAAGALNDGGTAEHGDNAPAA